MIFSTRSYPWAPTGAAMTPKRASVITNATTLGLTNSAILEFMIVLPRSEEHTSELQSQSNLVCRLLLEKKEEYASVAGARVMARRSYESDGRSAVQHGESRPLKRPYGRQQAQVRPSLRFCRLVLEQLFA